MQRHDQDARHDRHRDFKKTLQATDARKKRENATNVIRKNKRESALAKRRNFEPAPAPDAEQPVDTNDSKEVAIDLPTLVQMLNTDDVQNRMTAAASLRTMLSVKRDPPIQEMIDADVVPHLVEFLRDDSNESLQFEAAWTLTNIASGTPDQARVVIDHNAVPEFARLLASPKLEIREQSLWALGNIAGDSPQYRDYILQHDVMGSLIDFLHDETISMQMLKTATWVLSNLCRGKPQPPFDLVKPALQTISRLILVQDDGVLEDACWALSYLSDGSNDKICGVIDAGVVPRVVEMLAHTSTNVQTPAIRTVGTIVTGNELQTQLVIDSGALPHLLTLLLSSTDSGVLKETCWTISNITAGTQEQIGSVIEAGLVQPLVETLGSALFEIKREAAWALVNVLLGGSDEQVRYVAGAGAIPPICDLLDCGETRMISVALEGLEVILEVGAADVEHNTPFYTVFEEAGGIDKLEMLQDSENDNIYQKAVSILTRFFGAEP